MEEKFMTVLMKHKRLSIEFPQISARDLKNMGRSDCCALAGFINGLQRRIAEQTFFIGCVDNDDEMPDEIEYAWPDYEDYEPI